MEHFKKAGEFLKGLGSKRRKFFHPEICDSQDPWTGGDINLDGKMSVLEFFLSFPDLESLLEEDL